jgi:hypothetical protein
MITDASSYRRDGTVVALNLTKATISATMQLALSCPGPTGMQRAFVERIEREFRTFDDLIERGGADWIAETFEQTAADHFGGNAFTTLYLIGWHDRERRPGAYVVTLFSDASSEWTRVRAGMSAAAVDDAMSLRSKLLAIEPGALNGTPMPDPEWMERGHFEVQFADDFVPAVDLLHLIEIARHSIAGDRGTVVGGKAVLTSIDATGITQRVLRHWREDDDKIGRAIELQPVDWGAFRALRFLESAGVATAGMSRLQRERMGKKARKGTLRVAP